MLKLSVSSTSNWLNNYILNNDNDFEGKVLSIFNHSLILAFDTQGLIHITSQKDNLTPFSIYVENLIARSTSEEEQVLWHKNKFILDKIIIECNTPLATFNESSIKEIQNINVDFSQLDCISSYYKELFNTVRRNLLIYYTQNNFKQIHESLIKLLGLGEGLTPSGDDYLVGFIYGLYTLKKYDLINFITPILINNVDHYTNIISKTFILHALKGRFSQNIVEHNWSKVMQYGNTSGVFILLGVTDSISTNNLNLTSSTISLLPQLI